MHYLRPRVMFLNKIKNLIIWINSLSTFAFTLVFLSTLFYVRLKLGSFPDSGTSIHPSGILSLSIIYVIYLLWICSYVSIFFWLIFIICECFDIRNFWVSYKSRILIFLFGITSFLSIQFFLNSEWEWMLG